MCAYIQLQWLLRYKVNDMVNFIANGTDGINVIGDINNIVNVALRQKRHVIKFI